MSHAGSFKRLDNRSLSQSAKVAEALKAYLGYVLTFVCDDELRLLEVVAGGPLLWRQTLIRAFHPYPLDELMANRLYYFFCQRVLRTYGATGMDPTQAHSVAGQVLDEVEQVSAPSQDEIDASWEFEDASSPEGRAYFYGETDPAADLIH